jgi:class 3 adenylate cyclase
MVAQRAERRIVTCLFVDIVGSTDLTVSLGPERMQRLLGGAFDELSAIILEHGGVVEKFIGDAMLALFWWGAIPRPAGASSGPLPRGRAPSRTCSPDGACRGARSISSRAWCRSRPACRRAAS